VNLDVAYVAMAIHTCFKCFIRFSLSVANVSSLCFKSRWGVAHVTICVSGWRTAACRSRLLLLRGHRRGSRAGAGARFQTLARDAGGRGVRDTMRASVGCRRGASSGTDVASRAGFGAGRRELRASSAGVGAVSSRAGFPLLGFDSKFLISKFPISTLISNHSADYGLSFGFWPLQSGPSHSQILGPPLIRGDVIS
jgi:hypothetical protein